MIWTIFDVISCTIPRNNVVPTLNNAPNNTLDECGSLSLTSFCLILISVVPILLYFINIESKPSPKIHDKYVSYKTYVFSNTLYLFHMEVSISSRLEYIQSPDWKCNNAGCLEPKFNEGYIAGRYSLVAYVLCGYVY